MEKLITLFLLFFFSVILNAQDITGNLEGIVSDSLGMPLPRVNITVQSANLQGLKGTATNEKGYFSILYLPVGNYKVKISMIGFRELIVENVLIRLGKTTYLGNIILSQETINLPEVTISGEKQNIDPTSTTYGGNLQPKDYEHLPVSRDYKNLITLLPQANTSFYGDGVNVGGSTGFENKYFVDGVEVTDPLFGTVGMNLPYNFMQEVELKAGGYEAEYRSSLGGIVNVVTYSGTNDFHGSIFGFYTSNNISSNQKLGQLDPTLGDFSDYDIGFSLRGPIVEDKLWFNAAYNPTFGNHDVEVPNFGTYVDKTVTHKFASKLTWSISPKLQLFISANGDPFTDDYVWPGNLSDSAANPDLYLEYHTGGMYSASVKGIYSVSSDLLLNASIAEVIRYDTGEPATEAGNDAYFYDEITRTQSGGTGGWYDSYRYNTIANISVSHAFNTHNLTAGVEYKVNGTDNRYFGNFLTLTYDSIYVKNVWEGYQTVQQRIPSVYLQDSWQIFPSLRFNAGVRWDGQYIIGSDDQLAQTVEVPLQTRLGLIYSPGNNGSDKFFGSYGRYFQELNLGTSLAYSDQGYDAGYFYLQDPRIHPEEEPIDGWYIQNSITPEVENLQAQYYDEFSLGYEKLFWNTFKFSVQGLYRTLGQAIDDAFILSDFRWGVGNPGKYPLQDRPEAQRDYAALIISIERRGDEHFNFLASYVLSRDYGNYEGLYDAFYHSSFPNQNMSFDNAFIFENIYGLVPNDRTHVFKFSGSYSFLIGLTAGVTFLLESGTPLSEYTIGSFNTGIKFLSPRGSAGRTPTIWDLGARFTYQLPIMNFIRSKIILDLFHIASQLKPVDIDQRKYSVDRSGNPVAPNPDYGQPYRYQPSMSMRLGMEINF